MQSQPPEYVETDSGIRVRADWRWRGAQPGDLWEPKRGKAGTQVRVRNAMGTTKEVLCDPLIVHQHHAADRAVLCQTEDGRWRSVRWTDFRKYWKPTVERDLPPLRLPNSVL